jgi:hypothetical protein
VQYWVFESFSTRFATGWRQHGQSRCLSLPESHQCRTATVTKRPIVNRACAIVIVGNPPFEIAVSSCSCWASNCHFCGDRSFLILRRSAVAVFFYNSHGEVDLDFRRCLFNTATTTIRHTVGLLELPIVSTSWYQLSFFRANWRRGSVLYLAHTLLGLFFSIPCVYLPCVAPWLSMLSSGGGCWE